MLIRKVVGEASSPPVLVPPCGIADLKSFVVCLILRVAEGFLIDLGPPCLKQTQAMYRFIWVKGRVKSEKRKSRHRKSSDGVFVGFLSGGIPTY